MSFGYVLLGSAAMGALGGFVATSANDNEVWRLRLENADALESGYPLPQRPEPPTEGRKNRNLFLIWILCIALGGFVVWLGSFVLLQFLVSLGESSTGETVSMFERLGSSGLFAAIFGFVGFLVPGAFPAALIWHFVELRARLNAQSHGLHHQLWLDMQKLRHDLETGTISVADAVLLLRGTPADSAASYGQSHVLTLEDMAQPFPEVGQPVTPIEIFTVASAISRLGYVGVESGPNSTFALVLKALTEDDSPERRENMIYPSNEHEAEEVFAWAMHAFEANPPDAFRQRVGNFAVHDSYVPTDPTSKEALRILVAGVGGYRRALARGGRPY